MNAHLVICTLRVRQPNRLNDTLADIRLDPHVREANLLSGTRDIIVIAMNESDVEAWVDEALETYDLLLHTDPDLAVQEKLSE